MLHDPRKCQVSYSAPFRDRCLSNKSCMLHINSIVNGIACGIVIARPPGLDMDIVPSWVESAALDKSLRFRRVFELERISTFQALLQGFWRGNWVVPLITAPIPSLNYFRFHTPPLAVNSPF